MEEKRKEESEGSPNKKSTFNNKKLLEDGFFDKKKEDPYLEPNPLDYITKYVSKSVKYENTLIKLAILVMASAYTPNPLNLALESPQSEGKSHPLIEVAKLFPQDDVWDLGGMTPKALNREKGYLVDKLTGKSVENEVKELRGQISELGDGKEDKKTKNILKSNLDDLISNSVKIVDMQGKILLFLESPKSETFATLRPILSRDKYEIEYKFVDRAYPNGPQVTMEARIRGWPVAVYAMADNPDGNIWNQIRSRFIVVSPTMTQKKYKAVNKYTASKYGSISDPTKLRRINKKFHKCSNYIKLFKMELESKFIDLSKEEYYQPDSVSFTWNPMAKKLEKDFPSKMGQNMRDFKYFMSLMDASCLFSLFHRPYFEVEGYPHWIVTKQDLNNTKKVFEDYHFFIKIGEYPIKIFENIITKLDLTHESVDGDKGFSKKDLLTALSEKGKSCGETYLNEEIIRPLEQIGLLNTFKDESDKRSNVYVPFNENYKQISSYGFLEVDYNLDDFKNDFNPRKDIPAKMQNIRVGVNSIHTPTSGDFTGIFERFFKEDKSKKYEESNSKKQYGNKSRYSGGKDGHKNETSKNDNEKSETLFKLDEIIKKNHNIKIDHRDETTIVEGAILAHLADFTTHTYSTLITDLGDRYPQQDIKDSLKDMRRKGWI